jgi:hypothetical protein
VPLKKLIAQKEVQSIIDKNAIAPLKSKSTKKNEIKFKNYMINTTFS